MPLLKLLIFIGIFIFLLIKGGNLVYENSYNSKVEKTCKTMKQIQREIEAYQIEYEAYPKNLTLIGIEKAPLDGWKREIKYVKNEESYRLTSKSEDDEVTFLSCLNKERKDDAISKGFGRFIEIIIHFSPIFFILYLAIITFGKDKKESE